MVIKFIHQGPSSYHPRNYFPLLWYSIDPIKTATPVIATVKSSCLWSEQLAGRAAFGTGCSAAAGVLSLKFISQGKLGFLRVLCYLSSLQIATAIVKAYRQTNRLGFLTVCHLIVCYMLCQQDKVDFRLNVIDVYANDNSMKESLS